MRDIFRASYPLKKEKITKHVCLNSSFVGVAPEPHPPPKPKDEWSCKKRERKEREGMEKIVRAGP